MSTRRVLALVKGLPSGSALHRSLDPKGATWTQTHELLASLIEVLSGKRFPRPPVSQQERHFATVTEMMAFFGRARRK